MIVLNGIFAILYATYFYYDVLIDWASEAYSWVSEFVIDWVVKSKEFLGFPKPKPTP